MTTDAKEWNYDRIVTAQAQITQANCDISIILHRGYVGKNMKSRIVEVLRNAADDLDKMVTK